jgi:hypothetical protein
VKLKPLTLLLLLAGLVAIAYVTLGVSFLRQRSERDTLSSQIESAETTLAAADDIRQDLTDLPARLETANQQLAAAQAAFPSELDSDAILQAILSYANESQVHVLDVHTQPSAAEAAGSDEEIKTSAYRVLGFNLEVKGTFEQLVTFLVAIDEGATSTSRIGAFSLQESEGRHVLNLEVLSYARLAPDGASAPETPEDPSSPTTDAPNNGEDASNE